MTIYKKTDHGHSRHEHEHPHEALEHQHEHAHVVKFLGYEQSIGYLRITPHGKPD